MNVKRTHMLGLAIALTATLGISGCASNKPAFSSEKFRHTFQSRQEAIPLQDLIYWAPSPS